MLTSQDAGTVECVSGFARDLSPPKVAGSGGVGNMDFGEIIINAPCAGFGPPKTKAPLIKLESQMGSEARTMLHRFRQHGPGEYPLSLLPQRPDWKSDSDAGSTGPSSFLGLQPPPSGRHQAVVTRPSLVFAPPPFAPKPACLFQTVQRAIRRSLVNLQPVLRNLLDTHQNTAPMPMARGNPPSALACLSVPCNSTPGVFPPQCGRYLHSIGPSHEKHTNSRHILALCREAARSKKLTKGAASP